MFEKFGPNGEKKEFTPANGNSKWDPSIIDRWLKHAAGGGSVPQFCRNEKISKDVFYSWSDRYPEMMRARKMGKDWAEGWWLEHAQNYLVTHSSKEEGSTKFDNKIYTWITAGRFGHSADSKVMELLEELMRRVGDKPATPEESLAPEAEYELITGVDTSIVHDNKAE